jgi:predicted acyl esterase
MLRQESIKLEINVAAKMRDGTNLYADIYRPDDKGKHPAILARLPYNKDESPKSLSASMNTLQILKGY